MRTNDIDEKQVIATMKEMLEMKNTKDHIEGMVFLAVKWTIPDGEECNVKILQGAIGDKDHRRVAMASSSEDLNQSILRWVKMGIRAIDDSQEVPKEILSILDQILDRLREVGK